MDAESCHEKTGIGQTSAKKQKCNELLMCLATVAQESLLSLYFCSQRGNPYTGLTDRSSAVPLYARMIMQ